MNNAKNHKITMNFWGFSTENIFFLIIWFKIFPLAFPKNFLPYNFFFVGPLQEILTEIEDCFFRSYNQVLRVDKTSFLNPSIPVYGNPFQDILQRHPILLRYVIIDCIWPYVHYDERNSIVQRFSAKKGRTEMLDHKIK